MLRCRLFICSRVYTISRLHFLGQYLRCEHVMFGSRDSPVLEFVPLLVYFPMVTPGMQMYEFKPSILKSVDSWLIKVRCLEKKNVLHSTGLTYYNVRFVDIYFFHRVINFPFIEFLYFKIFGNCRKWWDIFQLFPLFQICNDDHQLKWITSVNWYVAKSIASCIHIIRMEILKTINKMHISQRLTHAFGWLCWNHCISPMILSHHNCLLSLVASIQVPCLYTISCERIRCVRRVHSFF